MTPPSRRRPQPRKIERQPYGRELGIALIDHGDALHRQGVFRYLQGDRTPGDRYETLAGGLVIPKRAPSFNLVWEFAKAAAFAEDHRLLFFGTLPGKITDRAEYRGGASDLTTTEGWGCPRCCQAEHFMITQTEIVRVTAALGEIKHWKAEWEELSRAECPCGWVGKVADLCYAFPGETRNQG